MAYSKQMLRRKIYAVSTSVGPGAANLVAAAGTALANNIPVLLIPADTFATRQPDPVLQQMEQEYSAAITTNDALKPVSRYWDRITRPEQLMSSLLRAFEVMTDPAKAGPATICISQDVEGKHTILMKVSSSNGFTILIACSRASASFKVRRS